MKPVKQHHTWGALVLFWLPPKSCIYLALFVVSLLISTYAAGSAVQKQLQPQQRLLSSMMLLPAVINIKDQNATCLPSWMTTLPKPFADESHTRSEMGYPGLCTLNEPSMRLMPGIADCCCRLALHAAVVIADCLCFEGLQICRAFWHHRWVIVLESCRPSIPFGIAACHCPLALQIVIALWRCRLS